MRTYRQPEYKTMSRHQQDYQAACQIEYERIADLVIAIIGDRKFYEWVDAFIPDNGPWSECLRLVRAYYNQLAEEQIVKEGQARQDGIDLRNEDPHL